MKKNFLILLLITPTLLFAQKYDTINVGLMSTVHLIFNSPIKNYDLGSGERIEKDGSGKETTVADLVIVEENDEHLKLAGAFENFETTNLFIETADAYYNFILRYQAYPKKLTHYITHENADRLKSKPVVIKTENKEDFQKEKELKIIELTLKDLAKNVWERPNVNPDIGQYMDKMKFFVNGVYSKGDYLFFRVNIVNEGNIKFDLGYEGYFIKDKKSATRKSPGQIDKPEYILTYNDEIKTIEKGQEVSKVYVFSKFTIDRKKVFVIELWEDKGQRKVELKMQSDIILNAKIL